MNRLIRAERLKLTTVRTYWMLALGVTALIAAGVAVTAATTKFDAGTNPARSALALTGLAQTCALLTGTMAVTGEYRHKTIASTALISPRRGRVLTAKILALGAVGLGFGVLATGAGVALATPLLAKRNITSGVSAPQLAEIVAGGGVATSICAALGVGVGAIVRNQVGAVVAIVVLLYVAEPLLGFVPHLGDAIQRYGIAGLVSGTAGTSGYPASSRLLGQGPAGCVLAAYAVAVVMAAAWLLRRRDITT